MHTKNLQLHKANIFTFVAYIQFEIYNLFEIRVLILLTKERAQEQIEVK
jgi:hypothetical protein